MSVFFSYRCSVKYRFIRIRLYEFAWKFLFLWSMPTVSTYFGLHILIYGPQVEAVKQ